MATLLEVVRTLREQGFRPKRSLVFVAYTDGVEGIDPRKLQDVGEMLSLAVMVLATDPSY